MSLVHGTTVAIDGRGVLIRGPSGRGKSDLALRLIDRGARLVADDQTRLVRDEEEVIAEAPDAIAGLIEARGLGLLRLPYGPARLRLVVDLVADPAEIERLPEASRVDLLGVTLPCLRLIGFEASATAKVRLAVLSPTQDIIAGS